MGKLHYSISLVLIVINIVVFLAINNNSSLLQRMILMANRVRRYKEYDRLILSGFAHAGFLHLLFNCVTLYFFGPYLEQLIGRPWFVGVYVLSIIGGNLYCLFMRKEELTYSALGASGGVMGVIFGFILLQPDARIGLFILPIAAPAWIFGIIFTLASILLTQLSRAEEARISHEGHLGGALLGAVVVLLTGNVDLQDPTILYFILGGLAPILIFALVKLIAPQLLYKHLGR